MLGLSLIFSTLFVTVCVQVSTYNAEMYIVHRFQKYFFLRYTFIMYIMTKSGNGLNI